MDLTQSKKRQRVATQSTADHYSGASFAVNATVLGETMHFLIDTGADVSVLPARFKGKSFPFEITLVSASNAHIPTHGCIATTISIPHLRRNFTARFIVADVKGPILGADFFSEHGLLVDVFNRRLLDSKTNISANLVNVSTSTLALSVVAKPNAELLDLLARHSSVFDIKAPRPTPKVTFHIDNSVIPKPARPYRLSPDKVEAARQEIRREISLGRMQRSESQYASPFFPVKKPDGSWRFVADYTKLNAVTTKDNYSPPRIDDLLSRIPHNCIFSKLDLQKAFFLIPTRVEDRPKTAITTPFGLFEYTVMPMGLKNASQTLQRYIDTTLADSDNTIAYCDDILLFSPRETHLEELDNLLQRLHSAGLVVNRQKSVFMTENVDFLGHHLTSSGFSPPQAKLQGLINYSPPKTLKQLRRFLGVVNFYRKFIPHSSELQLPLTALTHKGTTFVWTEDCQRAFEQLIAEAAKATELTYLSINDRYILASDASGSAVGAALTSQKGPIGFFSAQLNTAERNYSTYDRELTAIFKAVQHFEWLLFGNDFTLRVDHKPLLHMFSHVSSCERRRRQIAYLSTFSFTIEYIPGRENIVADALSRDKILDTIELTAPLNNLSASELRRLQDEDDSLRSIPSDVKSSDSGVWRDSLGRIYVPHSYRQALIKSVHALSHPGILATTRQIQVQYVWPGMRQEVSSYVRGCIGCQSSKVTRHTRPPFKSFGNHAKFSTVHIDFVGPLPSIGNKRFLVTLFDRGSRWFDAHPCAHATAESAVNALLKWVSHFGVPEIIISDRGTHFEAALFKMITEKLGIEKRRVTAYHPIANGAVERQHRRLKQALKARSDNARKTWLKDLPLVLLGLNTAISDDVHLSAAQIVYGRQLAIPNCIFDQNFDLSEYSLPERRFSRSSTFVPRELKTCKYIWLQRGIPASNMQRPYVGPYKVLDRSFEKHTIRIFVNNKLETVAMERVKPAFNISDCNALSKQTSSTTHTPNPTHKTVTFTR